MKSYHNAFPVIHYDQDNNRNVLEFGLTKREYFAALAMQANADNDATPEEIAEEAVRQADALINALNKQP
jgi:hypothetical protein